MPESSDVAAHLLDGVTDLPSVPAIALEIVRLTEDENCSLDQFAAVLSRDPALASKVLRFANSSLYGLSTPASNLQQATMVLGTRAVKLMSLSFSLAGSLPSKSSGGFDIHQYWRRSVLCAVAARGLAEREASSLADEAFLCGLLSRIGQLVLGHCRPDVYAELGNAPGQPWPLPAQERRALGCDGYEIGGALLRRWSLPDFLCGAITCAADPSRLPSAASEEARSLAQILHSASLCEELFCGDPQEVHASELFARLQRAGGMDGEEIESFLAALESSVAETAKMLDMEIDPIHTAEILEAAQHRMLDESLGIASEAQQARQHAARLEMRNRVLNDKAHSDALTGLENRAAFDEELSRLAMAPGSGDSGGGVGLILFDVDHFKSCNDRFGHQAGDEVLRLIAGAVRAAVRGDELSARYGGDEFAIVLPDVSAADLAAVAERVRGAVEAVSLTLGDTVLSVTVSVGAARAAEVRGSEPVAGIIRLADQRLYEAKHDGRNRCRTGASGAQS